MKAILRRHLWKIVCVCAGAWMLVCAPGTTVVDMGGSEVVGRLVTPENKPVAGAEVKALKISVLETDPVTYDTIVAASVTSSDSGKFRFDSLPMEEYTLAVFYRDDSLRLQPQKFMPDPEKRIDLGPLFMKAPGVIRGAVRLAEGGADADINCGIAGTSYFAITNSTQPGFMISGIFPVDMTYAVTFSAVGYTRVTVPDVFVKAGDTAVISDTVRLELDTNALIGVVPTGLKVAYDTLAGSARVSWNPVALADVKRYIVYDSLYPLDTVDGTTATITIFPDVNETDERTLNIQISAMDNLHNPGQRSEVLTFVATPPSWLRVVPHLAKVEGRGGVDTVYVALEFTCKVRAVDSILWWADYPDSVVKRTGTDGLTSGTDTLSWLTTWTAKRLFVTLVDNSGMRWTDSLDAASLLPIDVWTSIDSLQAVRRYACACVVDGKIYAIGGGSERPGVTGASLKPVDTVEVYDPKIKEWKLLKGRMAFPRFKAAAAAIENKIYIFGGTNGLANIVAVEVYDPVADMFSIVDSLVQPMVGSAACVIDGVVYLTGGLSGTKDNPDVLKTVITYRPLTKTWGTAGSLTTPRHEHQAGVIGSSIVVAGGLGFNGLPPPLDEEFPLNTVEIADPSQTTLNVMLELSTGRYRFGAAITGNELVVFGGLTGMMDDVLPVHTAEVCKVDGSGCHAGAPMPAALEGVGVASLDGRVYVIGGGIRGTASQKSTRSVYVYYP